MSTSGTLTVNGSWRRAPSSAGIDLKAQTITAILALPITPEPVRAGPSPTRTSLGTTDAIDNLFGVTRPRATRGSRHDPYHSLGLEIPPPPYAEVGLPTYSTQPNTEPITLARYLFKFGFLFPPFWILRATILIYPLTVPVDFEPSKSEAERRQLMRLIRTAELRWARRCAWALVALLVLGGFVVFIVLGVLRS